jgi:hypothetical protein
MIAFGIAAFSCKAFIDGENKYGYWGYYDRYYYYTGGCQGMSSCASLLLPKERRQLLIWIIFSYRFDLIW